MKHQKWHILLYKGQKSQKLSFMCTYVLSCIAYLAPFQSPATGDLSRRTHTHTRLTEHSPPIHKPDCKALGIRLSPRAFITYQDHFQIYFKTLISNQIGKDNFTKTDSKSFSHSENKSQKQRKVIKRLVKLCFCVRERVCSTA